MRIRVCLLLLLALAGCQPAGRYGVTVPRSTRPAPPTSAKGPEVPADTIWAEPVAADMEPAVPIVFVHEASDRATWNQLKGFWNETKPNPAEAAIHFAVWPPGVGMLIKPPDPVVKIQVPLGLDDPTPHIPSANPPTRGKWELGKQLFFDKEVFLQPSAAETKLACATCHDPASGFTDRRVSTGSDRSPPTLINSVYAKHQFWDGRAAALEEVVQQSQGEGSTANRRHSWSGAVERLRGHADYPRRFRQVFGTPPTEDAVGKALATYLRTVLVGNSLHDRAAQAMRVRGSSDLEPRDYEKALDDAAVKFLLEPDVALPRTEVAEQLVRGYTLFMGRDRAGCILCHGGASFTDQRFHNLGIGDSSVPQRSGAETGRFPVAPVGLKDRLLIGAYKTPTLRALPRTGPYFHDGSRAELFEVVAWHVGKAPARRYLDPEIRNRDLREGDVRALVIFLKALNGDPVADIVVK